MLDGETAFKLYDTYGFPLDLTQDALRQRNISVDLDGFNAAMAAPEGRGARQLGGLRRGGDRDGLVRRPRQGRRHRVPRLRHRAGRGRRAGAGQGRRDRRQRRRGRRRSASSSTRRRSMASPAARWATPARSSGEGFAIEVTDTQKKARRAVRPLSASVTKGTVKIGAAVELKVDHARRTRLRANHSATHLLHEALREVLGTHVAQKGSLVAPDRLRFDISHHQADLGRGTRAGRGAWPTRSSSRTARSRPA